MTRIFFDAVKCHMRKNGLLGYIKYAHINLPPPDVYDSQHETSK